MALALGVTVGERIYIDDNPLVVLAINRADATTRVSYRGKELDIYMDQAVLLEEMVNVSCEFKKGTVRLILEAPRSITIMRTHN